MVQITLLHHPTIIVIFRFIISISLFGVLSVNESFQLCEKPTLSLLFLNHFDISNYRPISMRLHIAQLFEPQTGTCIKRNLNHKLK